MAKTDKVKKTNFTKIKDLPVSPSKGNQGVKPNPKSGTIKKGK